MSNGLGQVQIMCLTGTVCSEKVSLTPTILRAHEEK